MKRDSTQVTDGKNRLSVWVNKSIFDIETYLVKLRQDLALNNRLDTTIVSDHILQHFNSISAKDAFQSVDYQLPFLTHLAQEYEPKNDLVDLLDDFVDANKNKFNLADIVVTQSGATRCKTNVRFAVNGLRDIGLIISKDSSNKRSWSPSIMGFIVLLNIQFHPQSFQSRSTLRK